MPKFIATMVFVGGGRPKLEKMSEDFTKNSNLVQWLNKRNIDIDLFTKLIAGKVPVKTLDTDWGGGHVHVQSGLSQHRRLLHLSTVVFSEVEAVGSPFFFLYCFFSAFLPFLLFYSLVWSPPSSSSSPVSSQHSSSM